MAPAVGHVLPVGGEDLDRLGSLIEGDAQGAADVTGEKGPAVPGVEQHKHPSPVLHLVLDGVDFDLAEKLGFVVGLETRQLLGRRFHAHTSLLSMEPYLCGPSWSPMKVTRILVSPPDRCRCSGGG